MKIQLETQIDRNTADVWRVLAEEFTEIHHWLDGVVDSYALPGEQHSDHGECSGRVCELSDKPGGLQAWETITDCDVDRLRLAFDVELRNAPAALPLKGNHAVFQLEAIDPTRTRVVLEATPELAAHGYLLYPILKLGISKQLHGLLDALKTTVEGRGELDHPPTPGDQTGSERRVSLSA